MVLIRTEKYENNKKNKTGLIIEEKIKQQDIQLFKKGKDTYLLQIYYRYQISWFSNKSWASPKF